MISDEELLKLIEKVSVDFVGQIDDLSDAIGILVLGRLYGWKVIRLTTPRKTWRIANELFGDLKTLLPERTQHSRKSLGLAAVDKIGDYWGVISGAKPAIPMGERKGVID